MANPSAWTLFPFFLMVTLFSYMAFAGNISFSFPPQTDIRLDLNASYDGDRIQLAKCKADSVENCIGWATYKKPVPLSDKSSGALANFTSHFQFRISNVSDYPPGDGLAFFMAPFGYKPPRYAWGESLGLFNKSTSGRYTSPVVAVEFDTFKNSYDPDDNHVGIDFNSAVSMANVSLSSGGRFKNNTLCNGEAWDAWVEYDGSTNQLKVFLLYNPSANLNNISKPRSPILSHTMDLSASLPDVVMVGLSAATRAAHETHIISAWSFSCEYWWDILSAPPPNNIPSSAPPNNISSSAPSYTVSLTSRTSKSSRKIMLISVFVCFVCICCFLFIAKRWYFKQGETRRDNLGEGDIELDEQLAQGPCKFSYAQLSTATRNFSDDEMLGKGGFGGVYRGILPTTNETVAIKRISQGSRQGKKEYISEVTIISKLRHRNLVRLLGWCHEQGELLLVYEFLPNGSLDNFLFNENKGRLNWDRRYNIACGIASALIYLHEESEQRVVHRDVKASNVLLDSNFNAKLGDFGLARMVESDHGATQTTMVAGTRGYMAPEYMETRKASPESDVYSFGAVALEIACGRQPIDYTLHEHNFKLVAWVWDLRGQGKLLDAADKKLQRNFNSEEMEVLMLVGLLCSHPDPKARPKMREVLKILEFDCVVPYVPLKFPVAVYGDALNSNVGLSVTELPSTSNSRSSRSSASARNKGKISSPFVSETGSPFFA